MTIGVSEAQARIAEIQSRFGVQRPAAVAADAAAFSELLATAKAQEAGGPVKAGAAGASPTVPGAEAYNHLFAAAGAKHGVSPKLLAAVAKVESNFNPRAVSHAGAKGLMQIMPATAKGLGVNPMVPEQAVDGAARLLATHQRKFGSLELALAAYNAGPGAVSKHGGIPPYKETQNYVRKVLALV